MWILKNSTNLLSSLSHLGVHRATSIQTFDFSTLYTSIPHDLLKSHMNNIINNAFKYKSGATRYTHIKVGRNRSYFTSDPLNGDRQYTANDICKMTEFWWIIYMLGFVDSFSDKWLAFIWEQTVPHYWLNYWLTCFSIPIKTTKFYDKCDAFGFHIVNFSLHIKQYSISTSLWCLCISAYSLCVLLLKL